MMKETRSIKGNQATVWIFLGWHMKQTEKKRMKPSSQYFSITFLSDWVFYWLFLIGILSLFNCSCLISICILSFAQRKSGHKKTKERKRMNRSKTGRKKEMQYSSHWNTLVIVNCHPWLSYNTSKVYFFSFSWLPSHFLCNSSNNNWHTYATYRQFLWMFFIVYFLTPSSSSISCLFM